MSLIFILLFALTGRHLSKGCSRGGHPRTCPPRKQLAAWAEGRKSICGCDSGGKFGLVEDSVWKEAMASLGSKLTENKTVRKTVERLWLGMRKVVADANLHATNQLEIDSNITIEVSDVYGLGSLVDLGQVFAVRVHQGRPGAVGDGQSMIQRHEQFQRKSDIFSQAEGCGHLILEVI